MTKKPEVDSWWQKAKNILEWIGLIITILGLGFGIGVWAANIQHKTEILELKQQYNQEIVNIKLEYNQRLLETINSAQNEIIELKLERNLNSGNNPINQNRK